MIPSEHLVIAKRNMISLPQNDLLLVNKIAKTSESFLQKYNRKPTIYELSVLTEEDEKKIKELMPAIEGFVINSNDLDGYSGDDAGFSADGPIRVEDRNREIGRVLDVFLGERSAYIVRSIFGIGECRQKSMYILADELGLTRERIRQLYEKSIRSMRNNDKVRNYLLQVA